MTAQSLLDLRNNGVNVTKLKSFFSGQLQLPAYSLLGEKGRPATLPGIGLRRGGKVVVEIKPKLRLIAPLMQVRQLLP